MTRVYLSPPDVGPDERRMLLEALDSGWVAPLGPAVDGFETDLASISQRAGACALSSGTAGLHLALVILGVGRGDRVVVSSLTFAASANAVEYVGAEPVFVDSEASSWNMDPELLAEELEESQRDNRLPKAVIAVDLYGQCANYARVAAICEQFEVPLIEDAAESLGASFQGRPAGSFGDFAVFSFNGNKIITTSGGGALVSDNRSWLDKARSLATQARDPAPHYEHSCLGFNYRMSNLLAAVGRAQLTSLEHRVERRRANNRAYRNALDDIQGIGFMPEADGCRSTFWLTAITIGPESGTSSTEIREALELLDIESRPIWKPMHLQPYYQGCEMRGGRVSEHLFATGLCLPSGSNLEVSARDRVCETIRKLAGRP